jgi:hypothetical protein
MKKFILGFTLGFLSFIALGDITEIGVYHTGYDNQVFGKLWKYTIYPRFGISKPFVKQCTKDYGMNGHGWVFVRREYNKCGKVSIALSDLIHGEYSEPINIGLEALYKLRK